MMDISLEKRIEMRMDRQKQSQLRGEQAVKAAASIHDDLVQTFVSVLDAQAARRFVIPEGDSERWCPTYQTQGVTAEKSTADGVIGTLYQSLQIVKLTSGWSVRVRQHIRKSEPEVVLDAVSGMPRLKPGTPFDTFNKTKADRTIMVSELPSTVILNLMGWVLKR